MGKTASLLLLSMLLVVGCRSNDNGKTDGNVDRSNVGGSGGGKNGGSGGRDSMPGQGGSTGAGGSVDAGRMGSSDAGCFPCQTGSNPMCSKSVAAGTNCPRPADYCCDEQGRFWVCKCRPRDGGMICGWETMCQ